MRGVDTMKRLRLVLIILSTIFIANQGHYVKASEVIVQNEVQLKEESLEYNFDINVQKKEAYAGCEFAVSCPNGYKITKVTYSVTGNTAGPVVARGYTWFSFFSANNDFSGDITAKIQFTVEDSVNLQEKTEFVLNQIKLYTVTGAGVETDKKEPNLIIAVTPEKSVIDEKVDVSEQEEIPQGAVEIGPTKAPVINITPTLIIEKTEPTESPEDTTTVEEPTKAVEVTNAVAVTPTIIPSDIVTPTKEVLEEVIETELPLGTMDQDQDSSTQTINWFLLIALITSLGGNVVLGYLMQKYKKIAEVEESEEE